MKTDVMLERFHKQLASLNGHGAVYDPIWIDWRTFGQRELRDQWLVRDLWPVERQVHLHAARKTGKSLVSLWIAGNLAIGKDPFDHSERPRVKVAYLDYEMTEDDLEERLEAMGFETSEFHGWLFYGLRPPFPPLDTQAGGLDLIERLTNAGVQAVVVDTFARVVAGEENSNDTYRHFYKWTGGLLKAAGIALLRLDHEGHTEGRSRGASAKADDVDVVFQLKRTEDGLQFLTKASRISWIPESLSVRETEPFGYARSGFSMPAGTLDKVRDLDAINVPQDASRRKASQLLKEAGYVPGNTAVLAAAIAYRQRRIMEV